ncbi:MAG: type II toxin-antitoxin system VapC family toxin [Anaerolineales bacterium]|nr:type II toxin-antitoxin system VapC family toxin [Anaerolineales bacterium]
MKLIDTDILIDLFHRNKAALTLINTLVASEDQLAISVVTLTELLSGMRPGEEMLTEELLLLFDIVPIDEAIGRQASAYLRTFRRSHRIDFGDALIAATAFLYGAELFTRNVKHYPMSDIVVTLPYERGG